LFGAITRVGLIHLRDDIGHREGFARTGDAQQNWWRRFALEPADELSIARGWSPCG
jgi:hypothetical protein